MASSETLHDNYQFVGEFVDKVTAPAQTAAVSLDKLGDTAEAAMASLSASTQVTNAVAAALDKISVSAGQAGTGSFERLQRALDPASAALARTQGQLEQLNRLYAAGRVPLEQYNQLQAAGTARIAELNSSYQRHGQVIGQADSQNKMLSFGLRTMNMQWIDIVQSIATGMPVWRTAIQQGGQMLDVARFSNVTFKDWAASIAATGANIARWIVTPAGLATTALVSLAGAAVALGVRYAEVAEQTRTFDRTTRALGVSANVSSTELIGYSRQLTMLGVSAKDATAAAIELAKQVDLTTQQRGLVEQMSPTFARATNTSDIEMEKQIAGAIAGHSDAIKELDKTLNLLTPSQYAVVQAYLSHNEVAKAAEIVTRALQQRFAEMPEALRPTASLMERLGAAWNDFMDTLLATAPVKAVIEGWVIIFNRLADAMGSISAEGLNRQISDATTKIIDLQRQQQELAQKSGSFGYLFGTSEQQAAVKKQIDDTYAQIKQLEDARAKLNAPPPSAIGRTATSGVSGDTEAIRKTITEQKGLIDEARKAAESTKGETVRNLREQNKDFQALMKENNEAVKQGKISAEEAAQANKMLAAGIEGNNEKIAKATNATKEHTNASENQAAALQRATDKITLQAEEVEKITAVMDQGGQAVARMTAQLKAQADIAGTDTRKLSEQQIADATNARAAAILRLSEAQARQHVEQQAINNENQIAIIEAETAAIGKSNVERETAVGQLRVLQELKQQNIDVTDQLAQRELASVAAMAQVREVNRLAEASYQELSGFIDTAFSNIQSAIVDAFMAGQGAAVNFGNVVKSIVSMLVGEFLKLVLLNPLKEWITGIPQLSLGSVIGAAGGGGGGVGGLGTLMQGAGIASQGYSMATGGGIFSGLGRLWGGISPNLGPAGIFSVGGIGANWGGLTSFMQGGLFGTSAIQAQSLGTNLALSNLGYGVYGPATAEQLAATGISPSGTGILGGASIGGLATGILGGFGLGALGGGLLQRTLGKTGPAPYAGAGLGAAIGLIGGPVGALIGGLVGGLGGGLIGPRPPSPYSVAGVTVGPNGQLVVDPRLSANQISPSSWQMIANQASAFNQQMGNLGVQVAGTFAPPPAGAGLGFFGSAKNPAGVAGQNITDVFSNIHFVAQRAGMGATEIDVLDRALNRSFQSFEELGAEVNKVRTFVEKTVPDLMKLGENVGSLGEAVNNIHQQFDPAIATAQELGYAEADLTSKRDAAIAKAMTEAWQQFVDISAGFAGRQATARAALSGDPQQILQAQLANFDIQAQQQRKQLSDQLVGTYGDTIEASQTYADMMLQLEQTLGVERLSVVKQGNDAIVQQQQQAAEQQKQAMDQARSSAAQLVTSIRDYAHGLQFSQASPLSPQAQLDAARRDFNAVAGASAAGDFGSMQKVTSYADTLLSTARQVYGSGQGYVQVFQQVTDALGRIGEVNPDTLTASIYAAETRAQTVQLVDAIASLKNEVAALRAQVSANAAMPSRLAA